MTDSRCICPHAEQGMGKLHGVMMGKAIVRTSTTKGCPVHGKCGSCGVDEYACYKQRQSQGYGEDRVWVKPPCCDECTHILLSR